MPVEEKWKANLAKVAFMKQFPGLLNGWEETAGKTIQSITPLPSKPTAALILFSDGSFTIAHPIAPEPRELTEGLTVARASLEPHYPEAYATYDQLVKTDQEALRSARAEKIIGAIENNMEKIPELQDMIRLLVQEWDKSKKGDLA